MKGIPRRKGATDKIESRSARNVCFSKRRQGLFRKAEELRRLIPGVSVTAIAFSPAGKPFLSADPPPPTTKNEIDALLGLNITTLNAAHLHSHRNDLLRLKSFLLSMHHRSAADHDPRRHRNQVSTSATQIPEQEEHGSQRPSQMSTRCDDVPSHSGSTMVDGVGIQEADDQEFDAILRDLLDDDDTNCDMDYEEFDLLLRDLLDDGNANCDMDYGPCRNGVPEFTPVQSDGIEEDDEFGMMLRNFLNDDNANMDFDACW